MGGDRGCCLLAWLVCVSARHAGLMPPSPSRYTSPDFLYIRSWLPCIFFSGGVTVGNIGRQLAMVRKVVTLAPAGSFPLDQLVCLRHYHLCQ